MRSDYTDYAVMINGEWGSGKTYFWNNQIKKKIESLKLNGKSNITISYGSEYLEEGATYKVLNKDLSNKIKIKNNIKDNIGTYKVNYEVDILFLHIKKDRIVNIIDDEKPIIELKGDTKVNICPNTEYVEEGYTAYDNYDKDITSKVNVIKENNII